MDYVTIIGFVAAVLTTVAFIPQVLKAVKTKSTKDISLGMYVIFCSGVFLWFVYGMLILSWPVIIANILAFSLALIILSYKIKYK